MTTFMSGGAEEIRRFMKIQESLSVDSGVSEGIAGARSFIEKLLPQLIDSLKKENKDTSEIEQAGDALLKAIAKVAR